MRSQAWSALQTAKSGPIMRDYDCYYYLPIVTALAQEVTNYYTHRPKRLVLIEGADRQGWGMAGAPSPVCMLAHLAHLPGTSRLALLVSRSRPGRAGRDADSHSRQPVKARPGAGVPRGCRGEDGFGPEPKEPGRVSRGAWHKGAVW